mgnify:CR=1 FL=1
MFVDQVPERSAVKEGRLQKAFQYIVFFKDIRSGDVGVELLQQVVFVKQGQRHDQRTCTGAYKMFEFPGSMFTQSEKSTDGKRQGFDSADYWMKQQEANTSANNGAELSPRDPKPKKQNRLVN